MIKIVQADTINGFVIKAFLGLHGFHRCGYAAVDEGQVIISAVRIRTHTQTILTDSNRNIILTTAINNRLP
ncbi:MAG: hypothetical protein R6V76_01375 [Desulfobacterales bacterium]